MNPLVSFVAYPVAVATALFVVALLVLRFVDRPERPASPALAEALFSLVLLRLVLPGSVAAPWTVSGMFNRVKGWWAAEESVKAVPTWFGTVLGEGGSGAGGVAAAPAGSEAVFSLGTTVAVVLACLWIAGAVACLLRLARGRRRVACLVAASRPAAEPALLEALERWRSLLGVRRVVAVRVTAESVSPFAWERCGLMRPVVVLPETLLDTPDHAEAALAHELAHVARRDDLRLLAQALVQALWWWLPIARWAGTRLIDARERAADARVLAPHAHGRDGALAPATYGRALLAVAGMARRSLHDVAAATAVAAFVRHSTPKKRIAMRLEALVRYRPTTLVRTLGALGLAVALACLLSPGLGASAEVSDTSETVGNAGAAEVPDTSAGGAVDARMNHPLPESCVSSPFGHRVRPVAPDAGQVKLHQGVDLRAENGRPVLSPFAGRVVVATEQDPGRPWMGTMVVVTHGEGLQSTFAHLGSLTVNEGDRVTMGQMLGTVGMTGKTTGPHLHWEVRRHGELVDPSELLTVGLGVGLETGGDSLDDC